MMIYAIVAVVSYLLGSIPFGYILVRLFRGEDVRATGSGDLGATNVMRSGSKGLGIATLILDASKGYIAVALAAGFARSIFTYQIDGTYAVDKSIAMALAAAFAILGTHLPGMAQIQGRQGSRYWRRVFSRSRPQGRSRCTVDLRCHSCSFTLHIARIDSCDGCVSDLRAALLSR